jgi:hypothetical protein
MPFQARREAMLKLRQADLSLSSYLIFRLEVEQRDMGLSEIFTVSPHVPALKSP